ncbi:MAG: hypothetical protein ABS99_10185 [Acetobacteraceae bacterium SCN 69-10]|nr:MAG: hypothetical protein ABS99_10185 [Acetobacteraceae bacterium SCN 69-10]
MAAGHGMAGGRRAVAAWVLYDWAYGAFTTVVSTFVFATYFTRAVAPDPASGAALWAGGQAAAGVLIALLSVPLALGLAGLATVAFEIACVFYNAMLPGLARPARLGRLSMLAWGAGYAGGLTCLGLCLVVLVAPASPPFGLDPAQAEPVRATALLAGAWMALFAWPCVVFVPEAGRRQPWGAAVRGGLADLRGVLGDVARVAPLRRFLLARLFFMDGLTTLFAFGGIYAAGEFGLDAKQVLVFGIALNVSAGLGAAGFALIEDKIGPKACVLASLFALSVLGTALLLVHDVALFWVLGVSLGVFVGPAQAASRSMMARMAPAEARTAWFGLFALSGRVTAFLGPAALAVVTAAFHSQRAGMGVIVVFLVAGAALLARVPSPGAER